MAQTKAHELAEKQREISIAEFFEKNRHLLGFDNKRKALLTTVKEAVDNSLDACEEARILPEIIIEITEMSEDRFHIVIEDNGPGIVKQQIPKIFAKLLYGSKFFKLSQSRGQQGIGISAAVLYSQLTTGKPAKITSKISPKDPAHYYELHINIKENKPEIVKEAIVEWKKEHGTRVEMELDASYLKGSQSVDEYLKQTAIINPHATIIYTTPKAEQLIYSRASSELPKETVEIKPHPYGVELGILMRMLSATSSRTLQSFLTSEFSRVGAGTAKEICDNAGLATSLNPKEINRMQAEKLMDGITKTKIMAPPADCISPIGEELLEKGLKKEINAEFYCSTQRAPAVYRGNPFVIEAAIAYGGELPADKTANLLRFANRVPLLYQQGACAFTESVARINWKAYGLQQPGSSLPAGPVAIVLHMASVWVPFTSEAKEALAHYPEIKSEIRLALQECGRKLGLYLNKKRRINQQMERANLFDSYIPEVAETIAYLSGREKEELRKKLHAMTQKDEIKAMMDSMASKEEDEKEKPYKISMKTGEEDE